MQWNAFINKNSLEAVAFSSVVEKIRVFIEPVFLAINNFGDYDFIWRSGDSWCEN
jgi:hypothetical protein